MKILVTGANGLLGQKIIGILANDPVHTPIATARGPLRYPFSGAYYEIDITDSLSVNRSVGLAKPDVIIHAAAQTTVDHCELEKEECWKTNVGGTENIVKAAEREGAHLIHVSTDFIFDGTRGPLDETATPGPVNYYGESKRTGELIVQKSRCGWAIVRTVLVYGVSTDMSRSNIVLWVKKSLESGKTIRVVNDQWRTPTLAEDIASGCCLAAAQLATGIFHISGNEMMTPYDIAMRTAEFFGLDQSLIEPVSTKEFQQPAKRPLKTGFIIDKAVNELGYRPHSFTEGLTLLTSQLG
jgi:dTDP-4-dehydrorhamnose reductase